MLQKDHILILALGQKLIKFKDEVTDVISKNEWNHVEVLLDPVVYGVPRAVPASTMRIGLYVFKQSSSMEDIRFTDPFLSEEEHSLVDVGHSQTQFVLQQQNLASLEPHVGEGRVLFSLLPPLTLNHNVNWDSSSSMAKKHISNTTSVQGKYTCDISFLCSFLCPLHK